MFHENEDEVMKAPGVCCGGSSCWHMFAPSVRVKKPGSCVKHLRWLHIQLLVVLLAGQASSNLTSAAPSSLSLATASAQTSGVHYHISVIVDVTGETKDESEIKAWLCEVFQNDLKSCRSPSHEETTTAPTSPQTTYETTATTLQSYNTTTAAMSTALKNDTTTTAATSTALKNNTTTTAVTSTTLKNNTTTTAATSPALKNDTTTTAATSTALKNDTTTTAATSTALKNNTTTTAATSTALKNDTTTTAVTSTTLQIDTTTTGATSTTLKNNSTTTAVTSTTLQIDTTTTAATSTTLSVAKSLTASLPDSGVITPTPADTGKDKPSKKPNPSQLNKQRIARQIRSSVTQTSGVSNDNTTDPCQEIDVSCNTKTAIKRTTCTVMLKLKQSIPPCCILRTLCAASKASSDIHVVGTNADRTSSLQNECSSNPREESSCTYTGQTGASCSEESEIAYSTQNNSTHCAADKQNKTCSCSSYCNGTDAYYTFEMSIQDPEISSSYLETLMSKLRQPPKCSSSSAVPCPSLSVALFFKEATVSHEPRVTNIPNYRVILVFQRKVPICDVLAAVIKVLQSETEISFNNQVTRAGVYINYRETSQQVNTTSIRTVKKITSAYCGNSAGLLTSQFTLVNRNPKPSNVCTAIEESIMLHCQDGGNVFVLLDERCVWPVSTPGPNVTTAQPNTTTTLSVNVTAAQPNATTPSVNVTSSPLNTTTEALNATTAAANVTVTATLNTTATTANESVPVTIESADSQANALLELTRDVSMLNSSQVDQLVSQLENLLSGPTVSLALGNTSVQIVSNLLGASPETLSDSSERIIGIVDTVALKLVLDEKAEILLSPAVALSVKPADGTNFQETFFSISDPNDVEVRGDPRTTRSLRKEDSSIPQGSIRLPPSLTGNLSSEEQQLVSRVQFNFYQKSTVFQDRSLGERKLNSGILGASVANLSISELQDDIVIHLRHTEPIPGNFVSTCVFWDFTRNDGSGGWNPKGCNVRNSTDNETICGCDHLTSFAILLDLSREPLISRLQATILTFITFIGCGISAIFLSVTLLTYLAFGKLRKDIPSKILIQLCLALLLLNLVFLVDAWLALYPDTVGLCISTAWFLHYFLLVSFTWMGLEAVHMYLALVKVFNTYISRYMLKFSLVGWGVPMIVVIIVIAIDKDNYGLVSYGKFSDGTSDNFCWLKNDIAFYVAVVAYFCVIFLFNIVIFVVVLVQLCRIKRQNPHNALHRSTLQDVRSVTGITILLGLTWGFAFFAWGPLNLPFMYLFAIFNSLQGFFIFVFHCAVKENVRRQWRTYLCCGRMRLAENSEWSRTATQKTVKKSSVTRLTSLQSSKSSKSNNSTSSSSFLVSDSSEQINGIGSPFEDRAITTDEDPSMDVILNEINSQYRNQQAP